MEHRLAIFMTHYQPLRARNQWPRVPAGARGFSLLELLIVIAIAAMLMGFLVVGAGQWSKEAKGTQTKMILEALDAVLDEYYTVTGRYFDGTITDVGQFIEEVQVGDIPKMIGPLRNDSWESTDASSKQILDGWGRPIEFMQAKDPSDRPRFRSDGPDELENSGDDLYSGGGEP